MNRTLRILLPIVVLVLGLIATFAMVATRPAPQTVTPHVPVPLVRVQRVELQTLTFQVASQGTVVPRTESVLISEVSGGVLEVAPALAAGGFFEANEVLLRLDPHDYRMALIQARAQLAQAELRLTQVQAEADVARREWELLGEGEPTGLAAFEPQIADARARVEAARAGVEQAERNIAKTEIRAPYAGRVREKMVGRGQFVNRGQPLASIYAVDFAEIRLPLPDDELAFLELPLDYRGEAADERGPEVRLIADFAGQRHSWQGRIVRTEGVIDPQSRMVHAVARVADPYGRGRNPDRPPLAAGLFVEAVIQGRSITGVAVLPRTAMRDNRRLLVVDAENRLRFRDVNVVRRTGNEVVIDTGLTTGDRVCLTALAAVTDGMQVRTDDTTQTAGS